MSVRHVMGSRLKGVEWEGPKNTGKQTGHGAAHLLHGGWRRFGVTGVG